MCCFLLLDGRTNDFAIIGHRGLHIDGDSCCCSVMAAASRLLFVVGESGVAPHNSFYSLSPVQIS